MTNKKVDLTYLSPFIKRQGKKRILETENPESHYICCACGTEFSCRKGNFFASQSPLYYGNDGYMPICIRCLAKQYEQYYKKTKKYDLALKILCMHWDLYIDYKMLQKIDTTLDVQTIIGTHISGLNRKQYQGKTFDNFMDSEWMDKEWFLNCESESDSLINDDNTISSRAIKRWGASYTPEEYVKMDSDYKNFKESIPKPTHAVNSLIIDLCKIQILKDRALNENQIDSYEKLQKLYQSTLTTLSSKTSQTKNSENDSSVSYGKWLEEIERYTPAEFYKDKHLFADFDKLKDYLIRFLFRPLKNLITGSSDMDEEYKIGDDE